MESDSIEKAPVYFHDHAGGRDIPTGTFKAYLKELGFGSEEEYRRYLNDI